MINDKTMTVPDDFELLKKFVLEDPKWMWDEWNVFFDFDDFCVFLDSNNHKIKGLVDRADVICSLGKSGIVFAAYLSIISKKPLVVFSVGEFINKGAYVIGFTKSEDQFLKDKRILVVDSHVRSGNTIRMMKNYLDYNNILDASWLTVIDCRKDEVVREMDAFEVKAICDLLTDNREKFVGLIGDESLLDDERFWMMKEAYWLGRETNKLDAAIKKIDEVEQIKKSIVYFNVDEYVDLEDGYFVPLSLFRDHKSFLGIVDYFYEKVFCGDSCVSKKVLFLPLTLGAVPVAVAMAYKCLQLGYSVKILYPLFRSEDYFKKKLLDVAGYKVIMIDDVVTTGGLIYSFYDKYIRGNFPDVNLVAPLKLQIGNHSDLEYGKYFYAIASEIVEKGGHVVIGKVS
jgi:orotate phosphoribosyltransferase